MRNVIYQPWGGLGDNLAHSTIPKLCHSAGIPCYISNQNVYRNQGIYDFVWGLNPYITGKIDSVDSSWQDTNRKFQPTSSNHIEELQYIYGFTPITKYPDVYYDSKVDINLKGKTIIDLSAHTLANSYNVDILQRSLKDLINKLDIKESDIYIVSLPSLDYGKSYNIPHINSIDIKDIFYYSDVLTSAKNFITLYSGAAVLAATIKNKLQSNLNIYVYSFRWVYNSCCYNFENTNYILMD